MALGKCGIVYVPKGVGDGYAHEAGDSSGAKCVVSVVTKSIFDDANTDK